jgi:hypothetical protein
MSGVSPIFTATENGYVTVVTRLITTRFNVNLTRIDGVTTFLKVVGKGHRSVVNMFITVHCDVNILCGYDSQNDSLTLSIVTRYPGLRFCRRRKMIVNPLTYVLDSALPPQKVDFLALDLFIHNSQCWMDLLGNTHDLSHQQRGPTI